MKANKEKIVLYSSFALYCIWTILSAIRHEPNADEYHVWRMVHDLNFAELWQAMNIEGHFVLWHLLQWPFVKWLGMDYHCIYCVSVPLMMLAAWLLLFKLNFNIIGKLLILFSFPFCYHFPVVARCYALIPPILLGLAILYQQKRYPILYCVLLGLLANTHAYIEGLVAILWCLFVYNEVILKYKIDPKNAKRNAWTSLITIVFVVIAFAQVVGSLIAINEGWRPSGEGIQSAEDWFSIFNGGYQFKSFYTIHRRFHIIPNLDVLATILAWVCVVIGTYNHIKLSKQTQWQMYAILFFGIAWQIYFACNIYGMNWQRIGMLYFVILFVLWISYEPQNRKWTNMALIAFWLLNTSSQYVMLKDLHSNNGGDAKVAKQYEALMINDAPCYTDYLTGVHDLMNHKFAYTRFDIYDSIATEKAINEFTDSTGNCYLLIMAPILVEENKWNIDTLVALDHIEYGYHLYYIEKPNAKVLK